MTHIVESSYTQDAHTQADGSRYTTERHVDNLGRPLVFGPYLCPDGADPAAIMTQRAARLNADFALRDAEAAEAAAGRIPWSKLEFRDQLGQATEQALDKLMATFEAAALPDATKDAMRTGFARWREAHYIERPLRPEVLGMLALLQSLGHISAERIAQIVAAAEA